MILHHVVILSGGMDSTTLLHFIRQKMRVAIVPRITEEMRVLEMHVLSFNYGQKHHIELNCAASLCERLHIDYQVVNLRFLRQFIPNSALIGTDAIPQGHYADESMKRTVVPGRNTLFLSCALAYSQGLLKNDEDRAMVYYGAHAGDQPIYPDCRLEFVAAMAEVFNKASEGKIGLDAPFVCLTKGEIVKIGLELGVDYSQTHTCYEGLDPACGKCGACVERLMAFDSANAVDPLAYADRETYKSYKNYSFGDGAFEIGDFEGDPEVGEPRLTDRK